MYEICSLTTIVLLMRCNRHQSSNLIQRATHLTKAPGETKYFIHTAPTNGKPSNTFPGLENCILQQYIEDAVWSPSGGPERGLQRDCFNGLFIGVDICCNCWSKQTCFVRTSSRRRIPCSLMAHFLWTPTGQLASAVTGSK